MPRDKDRRVVLWTSGAQEWWAGRRRHRDGGKPAIKWHDGSREWWVDGRLHRDDSDKPALISFPHPPSQPSNIRHNIAMKEWWVHGRRHRSNNKPAVIWGDGRREWWVDGVCSLIIHSDGALDWRVDTKPKRILLPDGFNVNWVPVGGLFNNYPARQLSQLTNFYSDSVRFRFVLALLKN